MNTKYSSLRRGAVMESWKGFDTTVRATQCGVLESGIVREEKGTGEARNCTTANCVQGGVRYSAAVR